MHNVSSLSEKSAARLREIVFSGIDYGTILNAFKAGYRYIGLSRPGKFTHRFSCQGFQVAHAIVAIKPGIKKSHGVKPTQDVKQFICYTLNGVCKEGDEEAVLLNINKLLHKRSLFNIDTAPNSERVSRSRPTVQGVISNTPTKARDMFEKWQLDLMGVSETMGMKKGEELNTTGMGVGVGKSQTNPNVEVSKNVQHHVRSNIGDNVKAISENHVDHVKIEDGEKAIVVTKEFLRELVKTFDE